MGLQSNLKQVTHGVVFSNDAMYRGIEDTLSFPGATRVLQWTHASYLLREFTSSQL
jgi:hypothetical protein